MNKNEKQYFPSSQTSALVDKNRHRLGVPGRVKLAELQQV